MFPDNLLSKKKNKIQPASSRGKKKKKGNIFIKRTWFKMHTFQPLSFARFLATVCAQVTDSFSTTERFQLRSF